MKSIKAKGTTMKNFIRRLNATAALIASFLPGDWLLSAAKWLLVIVLKIAEGRLRYYNTLTGLSPKQVMLIQLLDVVNKSFGKKWASETVTPIDDNIVELVGRLAIVVADKFGFKLYKIDNGDESQ